MLLTAVPVWPRLRLRDTVYRVEAGPGVRSSQGCLALALALALLALLASLALALGNGG